LKLKDWIAFLLLGALSSASFLWIKIVVAEVAPFTLVGLRVLLGALTAGAAAIIGRAAWPRSLAGWVPYIVLGVTSVALPFLLIAWGERAIPSAVASILNATQPLFTVLLASLVLRDDRLTVPRLIGVLVGFAGVVVLLSGDLQPGAGASWLGQAAVIGAAFFFAASSIYARRATAGAPGLVLGAAPMLAASLVAWAVIPAVESPVRLPALPGTWVALLCLGALATGLTTILWYYLLHAVGPTRAALVTYFFPLGGVLLGVVFLGETLTWQILAGAGLIVASLAVVNWKARVNKT